jgi:hypothetical protein
MFKIQHLINPLKVIKNMTEEKFQELNNLFNRLIDKNDLIETTSVIDSESILSRVYKKCDCRIDDGVLGMLIVFNKHIQDEQYESADKMKTYIINFY